MALEGWPAQAGTERSARILDAVRAGRYELQWCPIDIEDLRVLVSCDALKVDGVRVNVDAKTQQLIADEIGAVLLTPKLADEIYKRATKLSPRPQTISSSTQAMIDHSARVDAEIARVGGGTMVADVGKDWVIVKSLFSQTARAARKAANYGWHVPTKQYQGLTAEGAVTPGLFAIQGVGTAHSVDHTDYSEIARFALRSARYGELPVDLANVYTGDAPGNELVSHEGPLPDFRQPGVDEPSPAVPPAGGSSSRKTAKTALGGAAAGALALAAGAGPLGIATGILIGAIIARRA
jgi:hypothetical protein